MVNFGLSTIPTQYSIPPVELAQWAEANGFESLWFGEHSHIPASRSTPWPGGVEMPEHYKMFFDPFVGLTAAAAVTQKLKLGTGICLVPEHDPIILAKTIACLDRVANGRLLFGIGAGWNAEELANHGVAFKDRWKVTRERVLAMREIWTKDVAEFHGDFVDFDPLWCSPKPVQAGGPPVLLGARSKWAPQRMMEYCDGWLAEDIGDELPKLMTALREEMAKAGRSLDDYDLSVITEHERYGDKRTEGRIRELTGLGFKRIALHLDPAEPDVQWSVLERAARFIRQYQ